MQEKKAREDDRTSLVILYLDLISICSLHLFLEDPTPRCATTAHPLGYPYHTYERPRDELSQVLVWKTIPQRMYIRHMAIGRKPLRGLDSVGPATE